MNAEHPSKTLRETEGIELRGKKIILCVCGSIALFKTPEIVRELIRHGAEIYSIMSRSASKLLNPDILEWATGNKPVSRLTGALEHISLTEGAGKADILLIAPATANTISKIAHGIDDTAITTITSCALGSGIPILIAPAAHQSMYENPMVAESINKLKASGIHFVEPQIQEAKAKLAKTIDIVETTIRILTPQDLKGLRILVSAGPTLEPLDPIRVLTNPSTGKMGIEISKAAVRRGAEVTLLLSNRVEVPPLGPVCKRFKTSKELYELVKSELRSSHFDAFISAAAAADYVPEEQFSRKIESQKHDLLSLKLLAAPKIIDQVKNISPSTLLVAFKAEHAVTDEELVERAYERLLSSRADLIVANDVARKDAGFGSDTNEVIIIDKERTTEKIPLNRKIEIANRILDYLKTLVSR